MSGRRRSRPFSLVVAHGLLGATTVVTWGRPAHAADPPGCAASLPPPDAARRWSPPLDRTVSLPPRETTLRDALDRLAAAGRFRLSYAAELLPLDRRVCAGVANRAAGDALVALLTGTAVEAVVVDAEQVVLTPAAPRPSAPNAAPAAAPAPAARTVGHLERVVVTGTPNDDARSTTFAHDVVSGAAVVERATGSSAGTLAGALESVPGVWVWSPSASSLLARWGSVRGASSLGASAPKMYIDGIEVANPLLVTGLVPEAVERVEVIRGPQGAALHGADAIGGVVDITTRHEGASADAPHLSVRSDFGPSQSAFASGVLSQHHAVAARAGSATRSAGLGVALGTLGDYVPNGASRELAANGDARLIGRAASLTLTARFLDKTVGSTENPLVTTAGAPPATLRRAPSWSSTHAAALGHTEREGATVTHATALDTSAASQALRQYTLGGTATFATGDRWTTRAVAGVDGYRLTGGGAAVSGLSPLLSAADSVLRAARGGADRTTLRVTSAGHFGSDGIRAATVTLAAEHSALHETTASPLASFGMSLTSPVMTSWRTSTGLVAQTDVALHDALFLTGGLRLERDGGTGVAPTVSALPMLGAAVVRDVGGATLKLRAAYGRAIRAPSATLPNTIAFTAPESQSGVEAGADLSLGRALSFNVTRFDQRASGLVQTVASLAEPPGWRRLGLPLPRRLALANSGEITNRGWELQGTARAGRLSLGGTLALVDSRVARVAPSALGGELRAGDRVLDVPARTSSLTATWAAPRWSTSFGVARAADWVDYDRLAMARALAAGTLSSGMLVDPFAAAWRRAYWRTYDGVTRLRASASHDVAHGLSLFVAGDNLLDRQGGDPDNATVVPGRTVTLGVRAKF